MVRLPKNRRAILICYIIMTSLMKVLDGPMTRWDIGGAQCDARRPAGDGSHRGYRCLEERSLGSLWMKEECRWICRKLAISSLSQWCWRQEGLRGLQRR